MEKTTKVMATKRGLFNNTVYEEGQVFEVPASLLTAKKDEHGKVVPPTWFEEVVERESKATQFVKKESKKADEDLA